MGKASDNLSKKHRMFIEYYVESWNPTKAYCEVYGVEKGPSTYTCANRLLQKVELQNYIWELVEEQKKHLLVDTIFVLKKYLEVLRSDFVSGVVKYFDEDDIFGMDEDQKLLVQGIDVNEIELKDGAKSRKYKFRYMSKDKSIQALGKFLGMAVDKLDISGTIGIVTFASAVNDLHDELENEKEYDFLQ